MLPSSLLQLATILQVLLALRHDVSIALPDMEYYTLLLVEWQYVWLFCNYTIFYIFQVGIII